MLQLIFFKGLYLFIICLDIFRFMTRLDLSKNSIIYVSTQVKLILTLKGTSEVPSLLTFRVYTS